MNSYRIEYHGVPLEVEGTFIPGEPQITYYSDMSGYPGYPDSFEIEDVFVSDSSESIFTLLSDSQIEDIGQEVLDRHFS